MNNESPAALLPMADDPPLVKLAAMLQALEFGPMAVNLSAAALAAACRAIANQAKRASTAPGASESDWFRAFAMPVGDLLGCLPSSFADGNEHIIRKLRELVGATEIRGSVPDGFVLVPKDALDWLFGEAGIFECPPSSYFRGKPPTYWWRSEFRKRIAAAPAPPAVSNGEPPDWAIAQAFRETGSFTSMDMRSAVGMHGWIMERSRELARSAAAKGEGQEKPR